MKYNELDISRNRHKNRVGRGIAAGQGKTAGRGTKGQGARAGSTRKPGFEGGQNPLMQRLPKLRGFRSHRPKARLVTTSHLNKLKSSSTIDNHSLYEAGLVSTPFDNVKIVFNGEVTVKLTVHAQGASAQSVAALQKAGGSFKAVPRVGRSAKKSEV